jgi:hypothetical protein
MSYSTEATALLVLLRATECMSCLLSCLCGSRYGSRFLFDGRKIYFLPSSGVGI